MALAVSALVYIASFLKFILAFERVAAYAVRPFCFHTIKELKNVI